MIGESGKELKQRMNQYKVKIQLVCPKFLEFIGQPSSAFDLDPVGDNDFGSFRRLRDNSYF